MHFKRLVIFKTTHLPCHILHKIPGIYNNMNKETSIGGPSANPDDANISPF